MPHNPFLLEEATRHFVQSRSSINRDLHSGQEVVKLDELRLPHATNALNALEDVIGEMMVRFRARGIHTTSLAVEQPSELRFRTCPDAV